MVEVKSITFKHLLSMECNGTVLSYLEMIAIEHERLGLVY